MSCDPATLIEEAKCIITCVPPGMMGAVQLAALCSFAQGGGPYVLKTGDTMTGTLIVSGVGSFIQTGFLWANLADANNNTQPVTLELYHDTTGGGGAVNAGVGMDFRADSDTTDRQLQARLVSLWSNATHAARTSELRFSMVVAGVTTEILRIQQNGLSLFQTQVVGSRKTGWGVPTGVATRTTFDTAAVTLPQLAERVKALIDDLTSHGLIGP